MKVSLVRDIDCCRDCYYSSNSSQEHDCAFTSAPYPTTWYCNHRDRKKYTDYRYIGDEYKIDKHCPIAKEGLK